MNFNNIYIIVERDKETSAIVDINSIFSYLVQAEETLAELNSTSLSILEGDRIFDIIHVYDYR